MAAPRKAAGHLLLAPGAEIDGFLIGEQMNKGGMALLYEARKPGLDTPLMLKAPKLGEGEDPAAIVSFEMEMMILPRLTGPHVPKVYAVGDFARQPYIVMERIPGRSLLSQLEELPRPAAEVASLGARIADALNALHRQQVIHLDIKPSNIMFRDNGLAVLIDYGLSHHAELPDLMAEEFRLPFGTAPYMAPEQVMGIRTFRRSDVFALGCLLYFFATGTRPFGDPQGLKGLKKRLWEDPAPPRALNPDVPPWLQEIILRCMEPNPEHRMPTAAQLAFDLRHPDQVALTARAAKLKRDGWMARMARRNTDPTAAAARKKAVETKITSAPIVAAAVDVSGANPALDDAMRQALARSLQANPDARLACLNILKLKAVGADTAIDDDGRNKHVQRLIDLKHWAQPLGLDDGRLTFHVLEAMNPAEAILDYARANHVDHIIMGARAESLSRRVLGSVSAEVAGHAPCTVTVVRARAAVEDEAMVEEAAAV
jgi:non-specific serine/threonine protein kinase/protein-serine/threonine kinase